jgi:hypothetical protein
VVVGRTHPDWGKATSCSRYHAMVTPVALAAIPKAFESSANVQLSRTSIFAGLAGNFTGDSLFIGYIAAMSSIISYLVLELATRQQDKVSPHQEKLEQIYLENDILFNLPIGGDLKK